MAALPLRSIGAIVFSSIHGIYGVTIGTLGRLEFGMQVWTIHLIFTYFFKESKVERAVKRPDMNWFDMISMSMILSFCDVSVWRQMGPAKKDCCFEPSASAGILHVKLLWGSLLMLPSVRRWVHFQLVPLGNINKMWGGPHSTVWSGAFFSGQYRNSVFT